MKEALRSMTEDMMAMIRRKDFAPFNLALSGWGDGEAYGFPSG